MHDTLAQVLGYLHLRARTARRTLGQDDGPARVEAELEDMATIAHEAYQDVREAILGLRESITPGVGIVASLRAYLQRYSRQAGVDATIEVGDGVPDSLPPESEIQLVRVVQEALTNVRKHAGAEHVVVRFGRADDNLAITVEDDGCGFDPALIEATGNQFGLRSMRERVERVGGRIVVDSTPGAGTRVKIYFPLVVGVTR